MNSIFNRILVITVVVCALSVFGSSHLARMHGQEKIQLPGGVGEELPGRTESLPPIIYGNQTPFGIHPESQPSTSEPVTLPLAEDQETQTVLQQSLKAPLTQIEELLPSRGSSSRGALSLIHI